MAKNLTLCVLGSFFVCGCSESETKLVNVASTQRAADGNTDDSRNAGRPAGFTIGDARLSILPPRGYTVLKDEWPEFRMRIDAAIPPQNVVSLVLLDQLDLARGLERSDHIPRRWIVIQTGRSLVNKTTTRAEFESSKEALRTSDVSAAIARNTKLVNDYIEHKGVAVDKVSIIDYREDSDDLFAFAILARVVSTTEAHVIPVNVTTAATRYINGKVVIVTATALCETHDDISWTMETAIECAKSTELANMPP